ncbi:hypothetical protein ABIB73_007508 [Bradyrhizobium sp. F1.4.3]|uniref:hypothetical protein n=1 Tax=Bradyrhizobium sp. F1.4.3 TaxID=3156356 RepID=UPI003396F40C
MINRIFCILTMGITLSACAVGPLPQNGGSIAWDGLGRNPNLPAPPPRQRLANAAATIDLVVKEDALLARLAPRSSEWFAAQRKIDADRDKRLAAKLIICRGCSPPTSKGLPEAAGSTEGRLSEVR